MRKAIVALRVSVVLAAVLWLSFAAVKPATACAGYCPFYANATQIYRGTGSSCNEAAQDLYNQASAEFNCPIESWLCSYRARYTQNCVWCDGYYMIDGFYEWSCYVCQENPPI